MHTPIIITSTQLAGIVVLALVLLTGAVSAGAYRKMAKCNPPADFKYDCEVFKGKIGRCGTLFLLAYYEREVEQLHDNYKGRVPSALLNDKCGELYALLANRRIYLQHPYLKSSI